MGNAGSNGSNAQDLFDQGVELFNAAQEAQDPELLQSAGDSFQAALDLGHTSAQDMIDSIDSILAGNQGGWEVAAALLAAATGTQGGA